MPARELGADGIPEQLHHLDPLDRLAAAGAAQELIQVRADLVVLEVLGARVDVDEPAGDVLQDDLPDPRVADLHEPAVRHAVLGIGQHRAVLPGDRVTGGGIRQAPEEIAPGQDLAETDLNAAELLGAGDFDRLGEQPGDEFQLHRQAGASVEGKALEETGLLAELLRLAKAAVNEYVLPRDESLIQDQN